MHLLILKQVFFILVGRFFHPFLIMFVMVSDKATLPLESTDDGYIAKIIVPEGAKDVPINKVRSKE